MDGRERVAEFGRELREGPELEPTPHRTIRTLQQNINWIKGQLR
jgi:hypothetical protein